jgi:hypothetical protein
MASMSSVRGGVGFAAELAGDEPELAESVVERTDVRGRASERAPAEREEAPPLADEEDVDACGLARMVWVVGI